MFTQFHGVRHILWTLKYNAHVFWWKCSYAYVFTYSCAHAQVHANAQLEACTCSHDIWHCVDAQLEACACSPGSMHMPTRTMCMLNWKHANAQLKVCTCSLNFSLRSVGLKFAARSAKCKLLRYIILSLAPVNPKCKLSTFHLWEV